MYRVLIMIFIATSLTVAVAQSAHPSLVHLQASNGLPSSEVYDIIQDRSGYIWISTDNGVCRFDGYKFEYIGIEEGLTDPVIFYLFEDFRGWIWMYSFSGQVYIYREGKVHLYEHTDIITSFQSQDGDQLVNWIYVDSSGVFYTSLLYDGIVAIHPNGACIDLSVDVPFGLIVWQHGEKTFFGHKNTATLYTHQQKQNLKQSSDDSFFPVSVLRPQELPLTHWLPYATGAPPERLQFDFNYFTQPQGESCFIQFFGQLIELSTGSPNIEQVTSFDDDRLITHMLSSQDEQYLILGYKSREKGIDIFARNALQEGLKNVHQPLKSLLPGKTITHLLEDRQGGIWIATLEDGVFYGRNLSMLVNTIMHPQLQKVRSIAVVNHDSAFVRTQDHRIHLLKPQEAPEEIPNYEELRRGHHIYYDSITKRLWASVLLNFWQDGKWHTPPLYAKANPSISIPTDRHQSFKTSPSAKFLNRTWHYNTQQFFWADHHSDHTYISPKFKLSPHQRIFSIHESSRGRVFIGGMNNLYEFSQDGPTTPVLHHPAFSNRIEAIAEMKDGSLLVGTKNGGLLIWKQDTILQLDQSAGLTSNNIENIHVDYEQQIWVGTNSGLNRIQLRADNSYHIRHFTLADGMPSNEITDIQSWQDQLWVGTLAGVIKLSIHFDFPNEAIQPLIEGAWVNGVSTPVSHLMHLRWQQDNIRLAVSSLDLPQQGKITYRYRFSEQATWTIAKNPMIEVAKLSPGNYTFEVQAQGRDGSWSASTFQPIHLQNPFWLTPWFWVFLASLALLSAVSYYNLHLRRQAQQQQQKQEVLQLQNQIASLRQQAYQAQMNPHFVYNCLTAIQAFILSKNEKRQIIASDYLSKFAVLTRQALEAARKEVISLSEDIEMLGNYIELECFRFNNQFTYKFEISDDLPLHSIRIPALLIQPYVENAIIHGLSELPFPGHLTIRYEQDADLLKITVVDNGTGIYRQQRLKEEASIMSTHRSAGLNIAQRRIENTDEGHVTIQELQPNELYSGTQVSILLSLN
ncbi:MAG: two-component regulator propeller domain-containing protein [Bacteroidota bacterium]